MRTLTSLPESYFSLPTLLTSDFNLHYHRQQPLLQYIPTTFTETFTEQLNRLRLLLTSKINIPTHNKGNVLDLAFISSSPTLLGASTRVAHHLDATLDYHLLLTNLLQEQGPIETLQRLRFNTLDYTYFLILLTFNIANIRSSAGNEDKLDYLINRITAAIYSLYIASTNKSIP